MNSRCCFVSLLVAVLLSGCITAPDEVEIAPIHRALTDGNAAAVEKFARQHDQLSALNEYGETPLLYAVKLRKSAFVDILLSEGADVNAVNSHNGETPLIAAVKNRDLSLSKKLLDAGARLDHADNEGANALVWACRKGDLDIVQTIVDKYGRGTLRNTPAAILAAAGYGHDRLVDYLLSQGSPIEARTPRSETPLILASRFGHRDTVQLLLDRGADVNARDVDAARALTWAARLGRTAIASLLVEKGADINAADVNGAVALTWAARLGHAEIVSLLLDSGATPGKVDSQGFTPLAHAVRLGHAAVVKLLLARSVEIGRLLSGNQHLMYWAALQDDIAGQLYQAGAEDSRVRSDDGTPIEAAARYLWLARFYENKLLDVPGRDSFDRTNMTRSYGWAADLFDRAAENYTRTAKEIESQQATAELLGVLLMSAAEVTSAMEAQMRAEHMAEISALSQASSHGGGIGSYYSALDANRRSYTPMSNPAVPGGVYSPRTPPAPLESPSAYTSEAARCRSTAKACRAILACYDSADVHAASVTACVVSARQGIKHLN
jgi:ankyrin repeat protein